MPFIGELITLQCTKCGVKHQSVRGSNVVFKLDANGKITEHGNYLYVKTCECKSPEHAVVISFDKQKNESVPLWRDMNYYTQHVIGMILLYIEIYLVRLVNY